MARTVTPGFRWSSGTITTPIEPGVDLLDFILADQDPLTYLAAQDGYALVWRMVGQDPLPTPVRLPDYYFATQLGEPKRYLSMGLGRVLVARDAHSPGPPPELTGPAGAIMAATDRYLAPQAGSVLVWQQLEPGPEPPSVLLKADSAEFTADSTEYTADTTLVPETL